MRVALFHNRYLQRGGEDVVVETEAELLRKAGHQVRLFVVDNRDEIGSSPAGALRAGLRARWNPAMAERVRAFLREGPVDVDRACESPAQRARRGRPRACKLSSDAK